MSYCVVLLVSWHPHPCQGETSSDLPPSFLDGQPVHSEQALASANASAPLAATMREGSGAADCKRFLPVGPKEIMTHFGISLLMAGLDPTLTIYLLIWAWGLLSIFQGLHPRYMTHMTVESFHEVYTMWCEGAAVPQDEIASSRCFREVYESTWKGKLKMRTVSQHARCGVLPKTAMSFPSVEYP